jgi:hypothetical protein
MRVNFAVTRVNHQPLKVGLIDKLLKQSLPHAFVAPTNKSPMRIAPPTVTIRKIAPRRSCSQNPKHRIDELPIVLSNPAPGTRSSRKMRLDQSPCAIIKVMPTNQIHRKSTSCCRYLDFTLSRDYTI